MIRCPRPVTVAVAVTALVAGGFPGSADASARPARAASTGAVRSATGAAPGAPGRPAAFPPADKGGFGTAHSTRSRTWFTVQTRGGGGEIYYPDLSTPAARAVGFVVVDAGGRASRVTDAATHRTTLVGTRSLTYRQVDTDIAGHWRLNTVYTTDPARSSVVLNVTFTSLDGRAYRLYALYEPTLGNTPADDAGRTDGRALVAEDATATAASALVARPAFSATSNGFRGTSDGWTDLAADGRLDWTYSSTTPGAIVQTGQTTATGRRGHRHVVLTVGFGRTAGVAEQVARATAARGAARVARAYAAGWNRYLDRLARVPASLHTRQERRTYLVSAMVLAASEDKTHRGAYVASPSMPWFWGTQQPSGPYHLVWSRDLYEIATALIAEGDRAGAGRALNFLFRRQQKPDGSFPQNSTVAGTTFWTGLQLDEVADPIVLAYQLGRHGPSTWSHVRSAADYLLAFRQDGLSAPWSPQERWENQSGYSPATIASEIAGLVCAASIARANHDRASAARYLATADRWRARVKSWTVTTTGPYSSGPYFLRVTKDGHPNLGTTYAIGDSGPSAADQRTVVDPSFLELVRLGVLPARDHAVVNSLRVIDRQLGAATPQGRMWHRASFDGYGEEADGSPWNYSHPLDSFITHGRLWPILNGERGEYDLLARNRSGASAQLATMARSTNAGYLLPEQVWDDAAPAGIRPGTPTTSATPLAWTHAQFIRLAQDIAHHRVTERPRAVSRRYHTGR